MEKVLVLQRGTEKLAGLSSEYSFRRFSNEEELLVSSVEENPLAVLVDGKVISGVFLKRLRELAADLPVVVVGGGERRRKGQKWGVVHIPDWRGETVSGVLAALRAMKLGGKSRLSFGGAEGLLEVLRATIANPTLDGLASAARDLLKRLDGLVEVTFY